MEKTKLASSIPNTGHMSPGAQPNKPGGTPPPHQVTPDPCTSGCAHMDPNKELALPRAELEPNIAQPSSDPGGRSSDAKGPAGDASEVEQIFSLKDACDAAFEAVAAALVSHPEQHQGQHNPEGFDAAISDIKDALWPFMTLLRDLQTKEFYGELLNSPEPPTQREVRDILRPLERICGQDAALPSSDSTAPSVAPPTIQELTDLREFLVALRMAADERLRG